MNGLLPIVGESVPTPQLPTVAKLNALWAEISARPLYAKPNFWRYLKLRWRIRLKQVSISETRIITPKWKTNDCSNCTDICCVGPHSTVTLNLRDIATLIDIDRTELITQSKPQFTSNVVDNRPALKRHLYSRTWSEFPVLKQDSMSACSALSLDGKCTLYPHWPMSCARFPYSLNLDDKKIFYSRRCNSFWIRPSDREKVEPMALSAVAGYNQRIIDLVLLEYAPNHLNNLGLLRYLKHFNQ